MVITRDFAVVFLRKVRHFPCNAVGVKQLTLWVLLTRWCIEDFEICFNYCKSKIYRHHRYLWRGRTNV